MKRNILLMALGILALVSCRREELDPGTKYVAEPRLEVISKDVVFQHPGGVGSIIVDATGDVIASSENPWLSAKVTGNTIFLEAEENNSIESRYSIVTIASGNRSATVIAQQFGLKSDLLWEDAYEFPVAGGDLALRYEKSGYISVTVEDANWIIAELTEDNETDETFLDITVKPNLYNVEREGTVIFTAGDDVRVIKITQAANPSGINPGDPEPQDFLVEPAWTPKYYVDESDAASDVVGVEVSGTEAGSYFIKVIPAADFQAAGGDQYTYLNKYAFQWAKESPKTYTDSAKEKVGKLAVGSYLVYAIGVKPSAELSYTYAVSTFNVTKNLSPYERFLGTWSVTRGDQEDTWTITEKVADQSYTISGIESLPQDFPIEAIFNESDNSMTLKGQGPLGQYTFTNSGTSHTVDMYFGGLVDRSGSNVFVRGSYNVAKAVISEAGKMTVSSAGEVKLSDGNTYQIIAMEYYGKEDNSGWTFNRPTPSTFPFTAIQTSQGEGSGGNGGGGNGGDGGNGGGGGSTSGYEAWIGTWNVGAGRTVTVAKDQDGASYSVIDSAFGSDISYKTLYDAGTGAMTFHAQLLFEDGVDQYYFIGVEGNYLRFGLQADNNMIAKGTISGSTATIQGLSYQDTDENGSPFSATVTGMTIADYQTEDTDDYAAGWYTFSDIKDMTLPSTWTRASTSSISVPVICRMESVEVDVSGYAKLPSVHFGNKTPLATTVLNQ